MRTTNRAFFNADPPIRRHADTFLQNSWLLNMLADAWPLLALILLGAWHGLNPGMGWLFAVALGLQHRSRRAVFGALAPIALGHALAIGMVVMLVYVVGAMIPFRWLQICGAATLFIVACLKLWRARHPNWVG